MMKKLTLLTLLTASQLFACEEVEPIKIDIAPDVEMVIPMSEDYDADDDFERTGYGAEYSCTIDFPLCDETEISLNVQHFQVKVKDYDEVAQVLFKDIYQVSTLFGYYDFDSQIREDKGYPYMLYTGKLSQYPWPEVPPFMLMRRLIVLSPNRDQFVVVTFDADIDEEMTREQIVQLEEFLDKRVDEIQFNQK